MTAAQAFEPGVVGPRALAVQPVDVEEIISYVKVWPVDGRKDLRSAKSEAKIWRVGTVPFGGSYSKFDVPELQIERVAKVVPLIHLQQMFSTMFRSRACFGSLVRASRPAHDVKKAEFSKRWGGTRTPRHLDGSTFVYVSRSKSKMTAGNILRCFDEKGVRHSPSNWK